jgi:microcin C transport system substrate-binding protein
MNVPLSCETRSMPTLKKMRIVRPLSLFTALGCAALIALGGCKRRTQDPVSMESGPAVQDVAVQVEETGEVDPIAAPEAKRGGSYTTWGGEYPKSLNMWLDYNAFSKQVAEMLFEPLITLHPTRDEPLGILAESWEISQDKMSYTFRIHPQARWSDGKPVRAEDVQYYYDVIMDPKNLTSLFRVDMVRFKRPEVIDEKTVRITADEPHWKNFWTAGGFFALPKHAWKARTSTRSTLTFQSSADLTRSATSRRTGRSA